MKKKFTIHLDALLVILALFLGSLGLNFFLNAELMELTQDNNQLQWKALENSLNLDSQETYIKKLQQQLTQAKVE